MLQSLLDQNLLLPYIAVATLLVTAIMLRIGWSMKSWFAKRREVNLRYELRDAKAATPNLASTLRLRDETIKQLQDEHRDLRTGFANVQREKEEFARKLQSTTAHLASLTEELTALRGGKSFANSFDVDVDEDAITATQYNENPAQLQECLSRAEAAYTKLQTALAEKNHRISTLEASLTSATTLTSGLTQVQYDALAEKLQRAETTAIAQEQRLASLEEQKNILESLAERLSRSNHVVREAEREAQSLIRKLEHELEDTTKTLNARDASIHRLFQELRDNQDALHEAHTQIAALQQQLSDRELLVSQLRLNLVN